MSIHVHHRVVALERLRLEDARELVGLQAAGAAAHAAGARLAAVLEAMLLGAAAQHRRQQQQQQQEEQQQRAAAKPQAQYGMPPETCAVRVAAQQEQQQPSAAAKPQAQPGMPAEACAVTTAAPQPGPAAADMDGQRRAGQLPDPAGRLVLLQLRKALDV